MSISHARPEQFRPPEGGDGRIVRVSPERLIEAVERLLAIDGDGDHHHAQAKRFIEYAEANGIPLTHLFARLAPQGRISQVVLGVPGSGRTAMVFAGRPGDLPEARSISELIVHACRCLAESGVDLAQAMLEPGQRLELEMFQNSGFTRLASLSYLERPVPRLHAAPSVQWPANAAVESFREDLTDEVILALSESYQGTLDCPGLYGLRRTEDVYLGHRATGRFEPELWTILRLDDRTAGVLLLNPCPASQTVELVYLGLAPFARGRGLGRQLLRHGLRLLAGRPERAVTLAVDEANEPALSLYRREGFRRVLRRVAVIRSLRDFSGAT